MLKEETLQELQGLLSLADLVDVLTMQAILHTAQPTLDEAFEFNAKIIGSFAGLLDHTEERGAVALERLLTCDDYETRQSFQGLGGCEARALKDMLEEKSLI